MNQLAPEEIELDLGGAFIVGDGIRRLRTHGFERLVRIFDSIVIQKPAGHSGTGVRQLRGIEVGSIGSPGTVAIALRWHCITPNLPSWLGCIPTQMRTRACQLEDHGFWGTDLGLVQGDKSDKGTVADQLSSQHVGRSAGLTDPTPVTRRITMCMQHRLSACSAPPMTVTISHEKWLSATEPVCALDA